MTKITYCCTVASCTWGVPYSLVMMSFEVVVHVGGSLGTQFGDLSV